MIKKLLFFLVTIVLISCHKQKNTHKEWVYVQVETIIKKDTIASFVYGQMKSDDIKKMKNNSSASGIFFLDETRYINDDDLLQVYADKSDSGVMAFRIENVKVLDILKTDPVLTFDTNELHASCLVVRNKKSAKNRREQTQSE